MFIKLLRSLMVKMEQVLINGNILNGADEYYAYLGAKDGFYNSISLESRLDSLRNFALIKDSQIECYIQGYSLGQIWRVEDEQTKAYERAALRTRGLLNAACR